MLPKMRGTIKRVHRHVCYAQDKLGSPMVRLMSEVTAVHVLSDAVDVYDDSTSRFAALSLPPSPSTLF